MNLVDLAPDELERRLTGARFALDVEAEPVPRYAHLKEAALRWYQNRPIGIGFSCKAHGVRTYAPLCSPDEAGVWRYDAARHERVMLFLRRVLTCPQTEVIAHNAKYDLHTLGLDPNAPGFRAGIHDTTLLIHLYDSRQRKALEQAERYWLRTYRKAAHLAAHKGKRAKVHTWPLEQVASYCVDDAIITEELFSLLAPKIGRAKLLPLYKKELCFLKLLWQVERRGVLVDLAALETQWAALSLEEAKQELALYQRCGKEFNWASPAQLSQVLYDDLGIAKPVDPHPEHRHTLTKLYTNAATSSKLLVEKVKHPVGGTVLALRETAKLRQTLEGWRDLVDDEPALHTSFNQTNSSPDALSGGTRSGRLSSTGPNLQNIANTIRRSQASAAYGEEGMTRSGAYRLRNVLVARSGFTLVAIDYAQQEPRLLALLSGEERLLALLEQKTDLYADMAELIWHSRDPVHRRWAKDTTLAINYGMSKASLAEYLGLPTAQAEEVLERYFTTFPRVQSYLREVARRAQAKGFVRTWEGRIWRPVSEQEAYKALNAKVQGGAAGLFSEAALRIATWLDSYKQYEIEAGHIVLLIHDELVVEVPDELVPGVAPELARIAEVEDIFGVPFPTSIATGKRFGEMVKWQH